jgi:uncharacterized repeat protein (TIGR01451 family)
MTLRFLFLFNVFLFVITGLHGQAFINEIPLNLTPDQQVNVMERVGDTVYMGGAFSYIGARKPYVSVTDSTTALSCALNNYPDGTVYAVASDGHGGWIIGGDFLHVGAFLRPYLAQIDSNGNVTSWNPSPNGIVRSLLTKDSILYVGGLFNYISSSIRNYAAAYSEYTLGLLSWNASLVTSSTGGVYCFEPKGDTLYMGGLFTYFASTFGANVIGVSRVTGQTVHINLPKTNNTVFSLHVFNNVLYVGGYFTSLTQVSPSTTLLRSKAGSIDLSTNLINPWNPSPGNIVEAISDDGTDVILGGVFGTIQSQPQSYLAAVDQVAGTLTSNPINALQPDRDVFVLRRAGNQIYIGGKIYQTNTAEISGLFIYDLPSHTIRSWNPGIGRGVFAMDIANGKVAAVGEFLTSGAVRRNGLAAFRLSDHTLLSWAPHLKHGAFYPEVIAIEVQDSLVYIGGHFDSINGQPHAWLAAISRNSGQATSWFPVLTSSTEPLIETILVDHGIIYFGGGFDHVNGQLRLNMAAIDSSGNLLAWHPVPYNTAGTPFIDEILSVGTNIIVRGNFSQMDSQNRKSLALYDKTTLTLSSWNPAPDLGVYDIAVDDHRIYVTGSFTIISGQQRIYHAAYSTAAVPQLLNWGNNISFNNPVNKIWPTHDHIYMLGTFTQVNGAPRHYFKSLDPVTGTLENISVPCFPNTVFPYVFAIDNNIYISEITGYPMCSNLDYTLVGYKAASNKITGTTFFDNNQNGVRDTLEPIRMNELLALSPNSDYVASDQNGYYNFAVDTGMFTVTPHLDNYYPSSIPAFSQTHFSGWSSTDSLNDFGLYAIPGIHDVEITLTPTAVAREGTYVNYLITYKNAGTVTESGFITTVLPQYVFFDTSYSVLSYYNLADSLQWNYSNLIPGEQRQIVFKCSIGLQNTVGAQLYYYTKIDSMSIDSTPVNNVFTCEQTVFAPHDPNVKMVFPEDTIQPLTYSDYLTYNIYFQNTGNDTAVNVILLDTLSANLNINTIEFLGSSKPSSWFVSNRIMRIQFDSIQLPDSTTDFEGSQGFFTYRIKPYLPVTEGEIVRNTAAIYFDYNDAVITNTASTYFSNLIITSEEQLQNSSDVFSVFPNPANDKLTLLINAPDLKNENYEILDIAGNIVAKGLFENGIPVIQLPVLENGMYLISVHDKSGYSENSRFVICH